MRAFMRLALGSALASSGFVGASLAQDIDDFILLDTITLTASGEPVAVSHTGATVTVLTEDDISRSGTLSFGNLMAEQPGVSFDASGGPGTTSSVRIRGLGGAYVGARLDGFDVTDTAGTQYSFNFNTLGTSGLSRVEVLRGSQSALYGSEAIAGVIDVTTFRPTGDGFSGVAGVETGTANTHSAELGVGYLSDRLELAFSASRTVSDGGFSTREGGVEDDGYDIATVAAFGAYQLTDSLRVGANVLWRRNYADIDDSPTAELGAYSSAYQRGARVFAELESGAVHHELALSRLTNQRIEMPNISSIYPPGDFDGTRNRLNYFGDWRMSDALSLNWGYEDTRETFSSYGDTGDVRTRAVHAEALYTPSDTLDLSFALRHDEHEMFGGKATGRVAAAWRPAEGWTLRAVASTGFRAPSLYELYSDPGNHGFTPETSESYELGVEHTFASGARLQLTAFNMRIRDRIVYDDDDMSCGNPWPGCYIQVDGQTTSRGVELSGRTDISANWSLFGNYTYTDAHNDDGTRALKVPRHMLTLGVEGDLTERLSAGASLRHSAGSLDYGRVALPDYTLINTNFSYALNDSTEAYLRVENIFDQDYQTTAGYNQPGRQVFVGVRTSF